MTKYIACDENTMKEFDSYEEALECAKGMDETAAVFMQTGMSGALLWKKQGVIEDEQAD